ncbi:hypothetical protein [Catenulispora subtropica]|uniref:hypothetical protein n=1 Tax=Catenulispora subtropica TaxID=450798 RepID=UPI0031DF1A21
MDEDMGVAYPRIRRRHKGPGRWGRVHVTWVDAQGDLRRRGTGSMAEALLVKSRAAKIEQYLTERHQHDGYHF